MISDDCIHQDEQFLHIEQGWRKFLRKRGQSVTNNIDHYCNIPN